LAIPISYNLRNLVARKTTTLMTALGIALTVAVLLSATALVDGLRSSLSASSHPLHLLVMRRNATAELNSVVTRQTFQDLKFQPGIARNASGEPLASLELVTVIVLDSPELPGGMNVTVRGLAPVGLELRDQVRLTAGRWFEAGKREVVVGKSISRKYPAARLGGQLQFGRGTWNVVGVMDAGRGAANSEIFADLNQLASDQNRPEALSAALVRAQSPDAVNALIQNLEADRRLNVSAQTEKAYYDAQTSSGAPLQAVGTFIAVIMAIGSSFAAMNTMYAAVAQRSAEIGTLRVLGFSRFGILSSFLAESLLLSLLGGLLGCLLVLPLNNIETAIGNFVTFSEITFAFRISPQAMLLGVGFALLMGALGGLFPAASAARKQILAALRQI
jgi:putative ABC transport system permease protein